MNGSFAEVLQDVLAPNASVLSRDVAEWLLRLRFTELQMQRQIFLADFGNRGELSPEQSEEMANYRRIGNLFSILHAKAKLSLQNAPPSAF